MVVRKGQDENKASEEAMAIGQTQMREEATRTTSAQSTATLREELTIPGICHFLQL